MNKKNYCIIIFLGIVLSLTVFFTVLYYLLPIIEHIIEITYDKIIELIRTVMEVIK